MNIKNGLFLTLLLGLVLICGCGGGSGGGGDKQPDVPPIQVNYNISGYGVISQSPFVDNSQYASFKSAVNSYKIPAGGLLRSLSAAETPAFSRRNLYQAQAAATPDILDNSIVFFKLDWDPVNDYNCNEYKVFYKDAMVWDSAGHPEFDPAKPGAILDRDQELNGNPIAAGVYEFEVHGYGD